VKSRPFGVLVALSDAACGRCMYFFKTTHSVFVYVWSLESAVKYVHLCDQACLGCEIAIAFIRLLVVSFV